MMLDEYFVNKSNPKKEIEKWWKEKWLPYNLTVGLLGVLIIFTETTCLGERIDYVYRFLPAIFLCGFWANVFYYMGVIVELFVLKNYPSFHSDKFGRNLFWLGMFFSVFIMLEMEWWVLSRFNLIPSLIRDVF